MNNNDAIIQRIKGVPAQKETLESKYDPRNPSLKRTNDNTPVVPPADRGSEHPTEPKLLFEAAYHGERT